MSRFTAAASLLSVVCCTHVFAQNPCQPEWSRSFRPPIPITRPIFTMWTVDQPDGSQQLYTWSSDRELYQRWDGEVWEGVPDPGATPRPTGPMTVRSSSGSLSIVSLASFGTCPTPAPVDEAGIFFCPSYIAEWNGIEWSTLGGRVSGVPISIARATIAGSDQIMVAGPRFEDVGTSSRVAWWDGNTWHDAGAGIAAPLVDNLVVWDDGGGPAFYGIDTNLPPCTQSWRLMRWTGEAWIPLTACVPGRADALLAIDAGAGLDAGIYVAGRFEDEEKGIPFVGVSRWDGAAFNPLLAPVNAPVDLLVLDPGSTQSAPSLYAAGQFTQAAGAAAGHILRWDGATWSRMQGGLSAPLGQSPVAGIFPFIHRDGRSRVLISSVGGPRLFDGTAWRPLGPDPHGWNQAAAIHDDGTGPALYVAGVHESESTPPTADVVRWDGAAFSRIPYPGPERWDTCALLSANLGDGPHLYALTNALRRWNRGTGEWDLVAPMTAYLELPQPSMIMYPSPEGTTIVVGGRFFLGSGTEVSDAIGILRNGSIERLGEGITSGPSDFPAMVNATALFSPPANSPDDPPLLVAGGEFYRVGSQRAGGLAAWDGQSWVPIYEATPPTYARIDALAAHGEGSDRALYVAGSIQMAPASPTINLAKWDGKSLVPLTFGGHWNIQLLSLPFGGDHKLLGATPEGRLFEWDGENFFPLPVESGGINALLGATGLGRRGQSVVLVGTSINANHIYSGDYAVWHAPSLPGDANEDGSTNLADLATLISHWALNVSPGTFGDLDADGIIGLGDLKEVLLNWGDSCSVARESAE